MLRGLRILAAAALALGACGLFGASGCTQTFSCTGDMTGTCTDLGSSACAEVHGCHAVKGACMNLCDTPGASCSDPGCRTSGDGCSSICDGVLDQSTCTAQTASLGSNGLSLAECVWDSDSGSCKSPCAAQGNSRACDAESAAGCVWVECTGVPKDGCDSYSGDDCPTDLGCDRTSRPVHSSD
jgi:hypothetical protein